MEMAEFLKNEEPADDNVEVKFLKGLLWNFMLSKGIRTILGNFMNNNSVGGPAHEFELLDTMEL
eukprot:12592313-Ditylum_brightwellii.AAC.1